MAHLSCSLIAPVARVTIFTVMLSLGLLLGASLGLLTTGLLGLAACSRKRRMP